ncbi:hypothetical protein VNO80_22610 [Phaseolus coccineus]|uniref:Uncharacterized protein n=1 Tax=Phaseolus coccineus TaxID=3886 RepID=A0AAN9M561_PHACN
MCMCKASILGLFYSFVRTLVSSTFRANIVGTYIGGGFCTLELLKGKLLLENGILTFRFKLASVRNVYVLTASCPYGLALPLCLHSLHHPLLPRFNTPLCITCNLTTSVTIVGSDLINKINLEWDVLPHGLSAYYAEAKSVFCRSFLFSIPLL